MASVKMLEFPSVQFWIGKACNSNVTSKTYLLRASKYFEWLKKSPEEIVNEWKSVRYNMVERQRFIDLHSEFIEKYYCTLKHYAPKTQKGCITAVISFYRHHKIPIETNINIKSYIVYHNRAIQKEEIRRILEHASLRDRCFFLIMLESGLRPNTIVQLRYRHIKEDFEANRVPMKIELDSDILKDRVSRRFTFIGEDGFRCLKEYLSPRLPLNDDDILFSAVHVQQQKDQFLTPNVFSLQFGKIVKKLGLADRIREGSSRRKINLYTLRKYFRNNCRPSDPAYREYWMGHSLGTDEHYFDSWVEDPNIVEKHRAEYAKAYEGLRVYEKPSITSFLSPDEFRRAVIEYLKTEDGQKLLSEAIRNTLIPTAEILKRIFESKT